MTISPLINTNLIELIRSEYRLDWKNVHGFNHWFRVRENGLFLAERTDADIEIIELFAFFHDLKRENDGWDPEHGARAANYIEQINGTVLGLKPARLDLLTEACRYHNHGVVHGPLTVRICYDADRLDLGRVAIIPDPARMCTDKAKERDVIDWALERSQKGWMNSAV